MQFAPLRAPQAARIGAREEARPEEVFWSSFRNAVCVKSASSINAVHVAQSAPYRYAVTTGTRVQVYSSKTHKVVKTISRFKDVARSGTIRWDAKLIAAADDSGLVQVFDAGSRAVLRSFKGHRQPVHSVSFSPKSHPPSVLTASDDSTIQLYDLGTSQQIACFEGHKDYVRTASYVPSNPSLILSGSYDGTVKLWNTESPETPVLSMQHGYPVEKVLVHPSGTIAVSAGGPLIRIWDLLAGSEKCIKAMSNHQKTVTTLAWDGECKRLLSGGLDGLIKSYSVDDNWRVGRTMRVGGPVLGLAMSPIDTTMVIGTANGELTVRKRIASATEKAARAHKSTILKTGAYESFLTGAAQTGIYTGIDAQELTTSSTAHQERPDPNAVVEEKVKRTRQRRKKLKEWDRLLKSFRYADALDSVLSLGNQTSIVFALLRDLIHRSGLHIALSSRDDISLSPLLKFLLKNITDPRYTLIAIDVINVLLDIYAPHALGLSNDVDSLLRRLASKVDEEIALHRKLIGVKGALEMVFAARALA